MNLHLDEFYFMHFERPLHSSIQDFYDYVDNFLQCYIELTFILSEIVFEDVKVILNEKDFEKLTCFEYTDNFKDTCQICLEDYQENRIVVKTPCNHIFHKKCIKKWFCDTNVKCPLCREDIRTFLSS